MHTTHLEGLKICFTWQGEGGGVQITIGWGLDFFQNKVRRSPRLFDSREYASI